MSVKLIFMFFQMGCIITEWEEISKSGATTVHHASGLTEWQAMLTTITLGEVLSVILLVPELNQLKHNTNNNQHIKLPSFDQNSLVFFLIKLTVLVERINTNNLCLSVIVQSLSANITLQRKTLADTSSATTLFLTNLLGSVGGIMIRSGSMLKNVRGLRILEKVLKQKTWTPWQESTCKQPWALKILNIVCWRRLNKLPTNKSKEVCNLFKVYG